MDHTNRFNSALKGRYHFFGHRRTRLQNEVVTEYKCAKSGNSVAQSRDFAQRGAGQREHQFSANGRIRSTDCHVVPPRNDKPHITSRTVSPRNDHYHCNFYEFQLRSSAIDQHRVKPYGSYKPF